MKDHFYPQIDVPSLELMIELQRQDPEYILGGGYGPEIEALFLGSGRVSEPVGAVGDKRDRLEIEAEALYDDLIKARGELGNRDNAEKMAYFRTATSLLERIFSLQERALNLKQMARFQQVVLTIMDDILDGDQRTKVRSMLLEAMEAE